MSAADFVAMDLRMQKWRAVNDSWRWWQAYEVIFPQASLMYQQADWVCCASAVSKVVCSGQHLA
jgi:hypothetical protein